MEKKRSSPKVDGTTHKKTKIPQPPQSWVTNPNAALPKHDVTKASQKPPPKPKEEELDVTMIDATMEVILEKPKKKKAFVTACKVEKNEMAGVISTKEFELVPSFSEFKKDIHERLELPCYTFYLLAGTSGCQYRPGCGWDAEDEILRHTLLTGI